MIEINGPFELDISKQSFAHWAVTKPRRFSLTGLATSAIIRVRSVVLVHLALLVCAISGAGMFMAATYALGATT
jgi:hypothetical protein